MSRSPNYPAVALPEAVALAERLWESVERSPVTPDAAVSAFGYETLSGPARTRLSALKKYGLLRDTPQGLQLTPLAVRILRGEEGSEDHEAAIREAALAPELFRELAEHQIKANEDALRRYLLTRMDFTESGAKKCAQAFRDTVQFAKLDGLGYTADKEPQKPESEKEHPPVATVAQQMETVPGKTVRFSWPLSRNVSVEVTFTGSDVRPSHIENLRTFLKTVKDVISDSDAEDIEEEPERVG